MKKESEKYSNMIDIKPNKLANSSIPENPDNLQDTEKQRIQAGVCEIFRPQRCPVFVPGRHSFLGFEFDTRLSVGFVQNARAHMSVFGSLPKIRR